MTTTELRAKRVSESLTTMTEMIMPNDTNPLGNLMGGNLMRWMDIAAGICAAKHSNSFVVTVSVDHVSFQRPIYVGDVITLHACVTRAFQTSMEVYVEVFASDMKDQNPRKCYEAFLTFVAVEDKTHQPKPVPPVVPLTGEEQKRFDDALGRRELRLVLAGRLPIQDAKAVQTLFVKQQKTS